MLLLRESSNKKPAIPNDAADSAASDQSLSYLHRLGNLTNPAFITFAASAQSVGHRACLKAANAGSPVRIRSTCLFLQVGDRLACKTCFRCCGIASSGSGVQSKLLHRGLVFGPGRAADAITAAASSDASIASLAVFFAFLTDVFSDAAWHSSNGGTPTMRIRLGLCLCAASPAPELPLPPELEILNSVLAGRGVGPGLFDRSRRRPLCVPESSVDIASWSNAEATCPLPTLLVLAGSSPGREAATVRIGTTAATWSSLEVPPPAL